MESKKKVIWIKYHDKHLRWVLERIGFFVFESNLDLCIADKRMIEGTKVPKAYYTGVTSIPKKDIIAYRSVQELEVLINEQ